MLYLQRLLLIALILGCSAGLADALKVRQTVAETTRPHVLSPRRWALGNPYVEKLRDFCQQASAVIPNGEVVGVITNHRMARRQRPMLRMWLSYLMPQHHVRMLPRFPKQVAESIDAAKPGQFVLAYRTRPVRQTRLEAVWENSIGGVYRVTP